MITYATVERVNLGRGDIDLEELRVRLVRKLYEGALASGQYPVSRPKILLLQEPAFRASSVYDIPALTFRAEVEVTR